MNSLFDACVTIVGGSHGKYPPLLVLHHACGSAAAYLSWAKKFPPDIELWLVDLPGHGRAAALSPINCVNEARRSLLGMLSDVSDTICIFGHSMGALLAVHLAADLERAHRPPAWVGVSGANAPACAQSTPPQNVSDAEILDTLASFGQTPSEVFDDPWMYEYLLRTGRADFRLIRQCEASALPRITAPITVFAAAEDASVEWSRIREWAGATLADTEVVVIPGSHFSLLSAEAEVPVKITRAITNAVRRRGAVA
jgi:surfactin synthase thioesterase subunit